MSAAWFYNHRGRLQGPFEAASIIERIKAGELGPDDLVYQEGEDKWKPIASVTQFSNSVPKPSAEEKSKASEERQWVVLERRKGKANKQLGPYSADEMKAMLSRNELKLSDYVWRTGMKEWYRVQAFEELLEDPILIPERPTVPDIPTDLPEATQTSTEALSATETDEELLKNVVQISFKEITAVEPMPEEADGPELTQSQKDPRDQENAEARVNYKIRPDVLKKVYGSVNSGNILSGAGSRWAVGGVGLLLLLFLVRGAWDRLQVDPPAEARPEKVVAPEPMKPKAKKKRVDPEVAAAKPKAKVEKKVAASFVKISHNSKTGVLKVRTDASSHYATTLTFKSLFGKVLGKNSYYRVLSRRNREVNLRKLSWPRGYYSVEARMGEYKSAATVFVGSGKSYSRELRGFKKSMTLDFLNERVAYIKTADKLVDKATVLAMIMRSASTTKAWRRDYGSWSKGFSKASHSILRGIGPKSRSRYVMADMWLDLKSARKDLDRFSKSMRKKSKRTSSSSVAELGRIRNRLTKLTAKAQGLSLWR